MTQIRQMTTDFFVADAISPKAIPVIPTVLSRHPDRSLPSSRPPLHVIPTATPRHPDRSGGISQQARDDVRGVQRPFDFAQGDGEVHGVSHKKICGHLSNLCHLCAIFRRAKRLYNHCKKISHRAKRLYNHCKKISRRAKGFTIIARRFRTARRALQSLQDDFAPRERLCNHCKKISRRARRPCNHCKIIVEPSFKDSSFFIHHSSF